jgi:hypothetical protein
LSFDKPMAFVFFLSFFNLLKLLGQTLLSKIVITVMTEKNTYQGFLFIVVSQENSKHGFPFTIMTQDITICSNNRRTPSIDFPFTVMTHENTKHGFLFSVSTHENIHYGFPFS